MNNDCRECRKFGEKLFLKGERCLGVKCALTKRVNTPGTAPAKNATTANVRHRKKSEYGTQLFEKQKAKSEYGLREKQFSNAFKKAAKSKEATGSILLQLMERRLDNVVYRIGIANSRNFARQLVNHGHIKVNDKVIDIPSYEVKIKDVITPVKADFIKNVANAKVNAPSWIKYSVKDFKAEIIKLPSREEIDTPIDEQLVVEFYSR